VGTQLDVEEDVGISTGVITSGVGVGLSTALKVGSIVEEVKDGIGVSIATSGVDVGISNVLEVFSMVEEGKEGDGVSIRAEVSGVDVDVSDALGVASILEELEAGVGVSETSFTDVDDDNVAASIEEGKLTGDVELVSEDEEATSEAIGLIELESEVMGTSIVELETMVAASGAGVPVLEVLDVIGSAVDILEELSVMEDEDSKSSYVTVTTELDERVMLSVRVVVDEEGGGIVINVVDEREDDDLLLHLPNPS
jgi:hypothetical protein